MLKKSHFLQIFTLCLALLTISGCQLTDTKNLVIPQLRLLPKVLQSLVSWQILSPN